MPRLSIASLREKPDTFVRTIISPPSYIYIYIIYEGFAGISSPANTQLFIFLLFTIQT